MVSKRLSDSSQHQQDGESPSIESLIEGYHSTLLTLYRPVWSCPWPRDTDPILGTVEGLDIQELSLWQQAISRLVEETLVLQKLAGQLMVEGRQGEALAIYRQLADADPENPQVLHNLAGAFLLCGNAPEAERTWRQIMALDPNWEEPRLALAKVLLDRQEWAEAEGYFNGLDPMGPWAFARNLSLAFIHTKSDLTSSQEQGKLEFESLVDQATASTDYLTSYLRTLSRCGQLDQALALLDQAPPADPAWEWDFERIRLLGLAGEQERRIATAQSLLDLYPGNAEVLANVGIVLLESDKQQAIDLFLQAIEIEPRQFESWANLALLYETSSQLDLAFEAHFNALAINPLSITHLNLGNAYCDLDDLTSAERCYRIAILLQPFLADAWLNLGNTLHNQGHKGDDIKALRRAHTLTPTSFISKLSLALALLMHQDYDEGWALYEGRLEHERALYWPKGLDKWDGSKEIDELLIVGEQGIGDVVQFMRYSLLLSIGIPRVTILTYPKLINLVNHYGGFAAVHSAEEPYRVLENSAWYPMASILGLLGIRNDAVFIDMPYLGVEPESAQRWETLLRKGPLVKLIGLNWQGNPQTEDSFFRGRSFPLETYAPLADCEGIQFVSLQKGPGSEQLETCSFRDHFIEAQAEVDGAWDFIETLSILQACDLVITSDTSVAHLAGALGRPTWLLLKFVPEWRWGMAGETSPWYPSMRLFRQERPNEWGPVIDRVFAALQDWLDQPTVTDQPTLTGPQPAIG